MAHFAQIDANNVVVQVVVVDNSNVLDPVTGEESEAVGIGFLHGLFGADTVWVQTSYNGNFRGIYAGIGDVYDPVADVFVPTIPSEEELP